MSRFYNPAFISRVPNGFARKQALPTRTATATTPLKYADSRTGHLPPQAPEGMKLKKAPSYEPRGSHATHSTNSVNTLSTNSSSNRGIGRNDRFRSPVLTNDIHSDITHVTDYYGGLPVRRKVSTLAELNNRNADPYALLRDKDVQAAFGDWVGDEISAIYHRTHSHSCRDSLLSDTPDEQTCTHSVASTDYSKLVTRSIRLNDGRRALVPREQLKKMLNDPSYMPGVVIEPQATIVEPAELTATHSVTSAASSFEDPSTRSIHIPGGHRGLIQGPELKKMVLDPSYFPEIVFESQPTIVEPTEPTATLSADSEDTRSTIDPRWREAARVYIRCKAFDFSEYDADDVEYIAHWLRENARPIAKIGEQPIVQAAAPACIRSAVVDRSTFTGNPDPRSGRFYLNPALKKQVTVTTYAKPVVTKPTTIAVRAEPTVTRFTRLASVQHPPSIVSDPFAQDHDDQRAALFTPKPIARQSLVPPSAVRQPFVEEPVVAQSAAKEPIVAQPVVTRMKTLKIIRKNPVAKPSRPTVAKKLPLSRLLWKQNTIAELIEKEEEEAGTGPSAEEKKRDRIEGWLDNIPWATQAWNGLCAFSRMGRYALGVATSPFWG